MGTFTDKVRAFQRLYEKRFRAAARTATKETVSLAQRVEAEGGTMRIDTGFLRASLQGAIDTVPRGPTRPRKKAKKREYVGKQVAGEPPVAVLARWDPIQGQDFIAGWTAGYARAREAKDGFLRTAVQRWDITVKKAAEKAKAIR